jgi:hypothetical protein
MAILQPILFVISVVVFIIGVMPSIFFGDKYNEEKIGKFKRNLRLKKYAPMVVGMGLFVSGLFITAFICWQIL